MGPGSSVVNLCCPALPPVHCMLRASVLPTLLSPTLTRLDPLCRAHTTAALRVIDLTRLSPYMPADPWETSHEPHVKELTPPCHISDVPYPLELATNIDTCLVMRHLPLTPQRFYDMPLGSGMPTGWGPSTGRI